MQHEHDFGVWLRQARRTADLTQEALAEAAGCATQTLRAIESGRRRPSREMAARIAEVLQIPALERDAFLRLARMSPALPAQRLPHVADYAPPPGAPDVGHPAHDGAPAAPPIGPAPHVLATKLYRPPPDPELLRRPRLFARLDAGLGRPLTLVAAPAGSGKTTLISTWLESRQQAPALALHVAWLTLDAGDADPVSFLRYLISALQTIAPAVGAVTLSLLDLPQVAPLTTLIARLAGELAALPDPSILVLDDYHAIDSLPIHQALAFLLDHLPPQLHLVIGSRTDPPLPLARLRARRQLVELRAADLRFAPDEASLFLTEVMGLPLSPGDVAALEARTEGWIAGLQLAALSLQDRSGGELAPFVAAFAGSHRFVVDYLGDEVLAAQPGDVQRFLLATAVLDRMCGPLCDAVLEMVPDARSAGEPAGAGEAAGHGASVSQLMLEHLERSNLFVVPLDDQRQWYRYHHLFAQVLRQRLRNGASPEAVAALYRRAAAWFERQGLVAEAVGHTLAAQDWPHAAELLSTHGRGLMVRGHVHTVLGWLALLPAELKARRPALQLLHATACFFHNQHAAAEQHLQTAEAGLTSNHADAEARKALGHIALLRASLALFRGDFAQRDSLAAQALELLPPSETSMRAVVHTHLVLRCEHSGEAGPTQERQLQEVVAAARAADEPGNMLNALVGLAAFHQRQGRLRLASATYREAVSAVPDLIGLEALPNGANYYFGLGALHYEWDNLAEAETLLRRGQAIVRANLTAEGATVVRGYELIAWLHQARGDARGARATLDELHEVIRQRQLAPQLQAKAAAARARLALMQHDLTATSAWATASELQLDDTPDYPREQEYLTLARVRLAVEQHDPESQTLQAILALLERMLAAAQASDRTDSVIQVLLLQAITQDAQSQAADAVSTLAQALRLAAPEGYTRCFVDMGEPMAALLRKAHARTVAPDIVGTLLAAFPAQDSSVPLAHEAEASTLRIDPLTEREREVLRLLAAGHSNQAIADSLVLAVGTVKRHLNSIFAKLQVQSRLQAVARAREINLL